MRQDLFSFSRRASAQMLMRCADTIDPCIGRHLTLLAMGELSLNNVTLFSLRFLHMDSMTSHKRSKPAISRSELVIAPS